MKKLQLTLGLLAMGAAVPAGIAARVGKNAPSGVQAFERMKSLLGDWESRDDQGNHVILHFDLTGNGKEIYERYTEQDAAGKVSHDMVTMYYLDGGEIKLTHYCEAGNQPTMHGEYDSGKGLLTFHFVSATGLPNLDAGHMYYAVYRFVDDSHIETTWKFRKNQKDAFVEVTPFTRKR